MINEAPVVYAEGIENKYTGEFTWKEKYCVIENKSYHIIFNILLHNLIDIDKDCYEAYVRNTTFGFVDRHTEFDESSVESDESSVNPIEHYNYATFTDKDNASSEYSTTLPSSGKFISLHSATEHFSIDKMQNSYQGKDGPESAFRITVQLSGQGYDSDYINTSTDAYEAWKNVIENDQSTEQQIIDAWAACEGVKFKFFDVAGNVTYWVMPYIDIVIIKLDDLYNIKKLLLEFINTRPADLQLGTVLIGRTTIKVTNQNSKLIDYDILIELDKESLGKLYPNTRKEKFITLQDKRIAKIATEDIGNIDDSGWVIAHAVIDFPEFIDELANVRTMVRNLSRADVSLGEWIKECSDNTRKISLDPFVPQYLKETTNKNAAYYKFVKFTERYLNTMFKAYDNNCYISVLEAIARIGNFNDYTTIYKNLLDKYDNDHGDMLHITTDELAVIIDTDRQETVEDEIEHN